MSVDGSRLAIGAHYAENANGMSYAGQVRVYEFQSCEWVQLGEDIDGDDAYEYTGYSVSLNDAGSQLAIGAKNNDDGANNAGQTRVYEYQLGSWTQVGAGIDGESADDYSGSSVSMSGVGSRIVIGAPMTDTGSGSNSGRVRIYENKSGTWEQVGNEIDGEAAGDESGSSVSISSDGSRVAIGSPNNHGDSGMKSGSVRVYELQNNVWTQIGQDIDGEAKSDKSGDAIVLSADGSRLAIGAEGNDAIPNGHATGHVRVYEYKSNINTWVQLGADIDGEKTGDYSGIVAMNADGSRIAIGSRNHDDHDSSSDNNAYLSGHVRVFDFQPNSNSWVQVGTEIDGEARNDKSGTSVSMSADGSIVAIGSPGHEQWTGHVRVYKFEPQGNCIFRCSKMIQICTHIGCFTGILFSCRFWHMNKFVILQFETNGMYM